MHGTGRARGLFPEVLWAVAALTITLGISNPIAMAAAIVGAMVASDVVAGRVRRRYRGEGDEQREACDCRQHSALHENLLMAAPFGARRW